MRNFQGIIVYSSDIWRTSRWRLHIETQILKILFFLVPSPPFYLSWIYLSWIFYLELAMCFCWRLTELSQKNHLPARSAVACQFERCWFLRKIATFKTSISTVNEVIKRLYVKVKQLTSEFGTQSWRDWNFRVGWNQSMASKTTC